MTIDDGDGVPFRAEGDLEDQLVMGLQQHIGLYLRQP